MGSCLWEGCGGDVSLSKAYFVNQLWDAALCAIGFSAPTQTGDSVYVVSIGAGVMADPAAQQCHSGLCFFQALLAFTSIFHLED